MKFFRVLVLLLVAICFTNCTVKESIVFNQDGSGNYLISYDMATVMEQMKETFSEGEEDTDSSEKSKGKVMDTTMVFSEIMETFKDSVAALPEEKRLAFEAVKDMYMQMRMDEDNGVFDFGIGLNFKSIDDLKGIQERIEKAKSLNSQNGQVDAMKGSPLGKFMADEDTNVAYQMTDSGFSRSTTLPENWNAEEINFNANDETDQKFIEYFENAYYVVEYTFPKQIKKSSFKNAEFSNNNKTIAYKVNWIEFIKNPKVLDINLTFADE